MKKLKKRTKILIALAVVLALGAGAVGTLQYVGLIDLFPHYNKPAEGQVRVACVGDSVTFGHGIPNRSSNSYPAQLGKLLGGGYCVNNYGISGSTATSTGDQPYTETAAYPKSLEFEPEIVVLMLGSNDSKPYNWNAEQFEQDYNALLDVYLALPSNPEIWVVLPTPVFPVNGEVGFHIDGDVIQNEVVPLTRRIAEERGLNVIDMNAAFAGRDDLFSDGCHPTKEGAALYAKTVYEALTGENDRG
ncbi:MAG: hypothetical protein IK104_05565 [Clostridia bacterium]|nr:hypothetical protein [Clostridia bacterium]